MRKFNHQFHPYIHFYIITLIVYTIATLKDLVKAYLNGNPEKVWLWQNITPQVGTICLLFTLGLLIFTVKYNSSWLTYLEIPLACANFPTLAAFANIALKKAYHMLWQGHEYTIYLQAIDVGILASSIICITITIVSYIIIYIATFSNYHLQTI